MDLRTRRLLRKLVGLQGSDNEKERASAWRRIDEILKKHRQSWVELPELIGAIPDDDPQPAAPANDHMINIGPLDLVEGMFRRYAQVKDYEYVAASLWVVHAYVYDRFVHTPRLALTSPTTDCGKSTMLLLLEALCPSPQKTDDITPATLFRLVESGVTTLLCDEVDNANLAHNRTFLTFANGGFHRSGRIGRTINGQAKIYSTFAPMALAAVNAVSLPVALRRRSISIHMERAADSSDIRRFDQISAKADLDIVRQLASAWANQATLAPDPAMPKELGWRGADVWRVLISIADAYGEDWPERARSAARIMARNYNDEDIAVTLLRHIREIFEVHLVDRIYSALLVGALLDLEDGPWSEWRGVKDDQPPRKLTQATVASVLKAFHIRPRSIWPAGRTADSKSRRGYYKADFEPAWRSYCPRGDTPPQAKVFKLLRDD